MNKNDRLLLYSKAFIDRSELQTKVGESDETTCNAKIYEEKQRTKCYIRIKIISLKGNNKGRTNMKRKSNTPAYI